jgi:hypothetical protein
VRGPGEAELRRGVHARLHDPHGDQGRQPGIFFVCKLTSAGGILRAVPSERVSDSTMRASCKTLIAATGLDPSEYATHSSKRGGALMALQAGLSTAQIQELGRWSSAAMVSRYAKGDNIP